jgi:hypothetical protein
MEGLFQPLHLLVLLGLLIAFPLGLYVCVRVVRAAWRR